MISLPPPRRSSPAPWMLAAGAVFVLVAAFLVLADFESERVAGRGFNLGGPSAPARGPRFAERREGTGLSMVRDGASAPPGFAPESLPGAAAGAGLAAAGAPPAAGGAPPPASPGNAPAPGRTAEPPPDPKELAAAGVPSSAAGLSNLGATKGMLSALAAKLIDHPRVLKAVFDNKLVVDAFMSRDRVRRNCSSGAELGAYISNSSSPGMGRVLSVVSQGLSRPQTAAALADTEMGRRLSACPSVAALTSDPAGVARIAISNPSLLGFVSDPRVAQALASNPQASSALGRVAAALGSKN